MEIYSLRTSANFIFNNSAKKNPTPEIEIPRIEEQSNSETFAAPQEQNERVNFSSMSPRELRDMATEYYQAGQIQQTIYSELSSELPTHALNAMGEVVDLTHITDDTYFDFGSYFRDQLTIAQSIGDPAKAEVLEDVVSFIDSI
ncbi:hypothetical protein [Agrobacterium sp.]|jgi:hypothetical protein|uniref:hypothetical protein n=1 Tax=Agrobacterium sp. TaxID=361 RepID=UPI0028B1E0C4